MANKYTRPQSEVYQLLDITQQATGDHLAACIVGAQYDLYRFGTEVTVGTEFYAREESQDIQFDYAQDAGIDYEVDTNSVSVYADGLRAFYGKFTSNISIDSDNKMIVRCTEANKAFAFAGDIPSGKDLATPLGGVQVQVGDIVRASLNTSSSDACAECEVVALVGEKIPASSAVSADIKGSGTLVKSDITADVTGYTGTKDKIIVLEAKIDGTSAKALTEVTWIATDATGTELASNIKFTTTSPVAIGTTGVTVKVSSTSKTVGNGSTITVVVNAASVSDNVFDGLLLSNIPVDLSTNPSTVYYLAVGKDVTGLLENKEGEVPIYTVSADKVTIAAGPTATITKRDGTTKEVEIENGIGTLYPQFRVLKKYPDDDDIVEISGDGDDAIEAIQEAFGTIDVSNDLAYGVYTALIGSAGRTVHAYRTRGTDKDAFQAPLNKSEFNSSLYSFVPLTEDKEIIDMYVAFNNDMSAPDVKRWRRTLVGIDAPGEYTLASFDNNRQHLTCTVTPDAKGKNTILQCNNAYADADSFNFKEVRYHGSVLKVVPGDKIKVGDQTYTIATVSGKSVGLRDAMPTTLNHAPFSVVKADTPANTIEYVGAIAKTLNTRRASVVFCDGGTTFDSKDRLVRVSSKFLAAEIAGISSAVVPQQSITRTEINSISAAHSMYSKYTQKQLDELASQGVLIVTQDHKNTKCYIRHQLTTEMDKGNLYYEDSCTRNLDAISYDAADIIDRYIGKANVTPAALRLVRNELEHLYTSKTAVQASLDETTAAMVGPQLVQFENLTVYQDKEFLDRIVARVDLYLPLPMNGVRLFQMAYIAKVTI